MTNVDSLKNSLKRMIRNAYPLEDIQQLVEELQNKGYSDFDEFYSLAYMINKAGHLRGELNEVVEFLSEVC